MGIPETGLHLAKAWSVQIKEHLSEAKPLSISADLKVLANQGNMGQSTFIVKVTVFVAGTFDLFNVICKQRHGNEYNPFLKREKNNHFFRL